MNLGVHTNIIQPTTPHKELQMVFACHKHLINTSCCCYLLLRQGIEEGKANPLFHMPHFYASVLLTPAEGALPNIWGPCVWLLPGDQPVQKELVALGAIPLRWPRASPHVCSRHTWYSRPRGSLLIKTLSLCFSAGFFCQVP